MRSALFRYIKLKYVRKAVIAGLACLTTVFLVLGSISAITGIFFRISALQLFSPLQSKDLASVVMWGSEIQFKVAAPLRTATHSSSSGKSTTYRFVLEGWMIVLWYREVYHTYEWAPTYVPSVKKLSLSTIEITFLRWWVVPIMTGIWPLWVAIARVHAWLRRRRRGRLGLCLHCGYPRQGLSGPQCPECGASAPAAVEITERAAVQ